VRGQQGEPDSVELTAAYHEVEACVSALEPAIGEELRGAEKSLDA
jgi:hypothetical protein